PSSLLMTHPRFEWRRSMAVGVYSSKRAALAIAAACCSCAVQAQEEDLSFTSTWCPSASERTYLEKNFELTMKGCCIQLAHPRDPSGTPHDAVAWMRRHLVP